MHSPYSAIRGLLSRTFVAALRTKIFSSPNCTVLSRTTKVLSPSETLLRGVAVSQSNLFHTSCTAKRKSRLDDYYGDGEEQGKTSRWLKKNEKIYPPQAPGEEQRPAWICHQRSNIKYSPKKMWYIAAMIRGMSIDEALKQLSFSSKKGAHIVKEVLQEAQQMAVEIENVEYKSNLWIGESFVGKGVFVKGLRRHARARFGRVDYKHCHYFVRLVEGSPPENYYPKEPDGNEKLEQYIDEWRSRRIILSL